MFQCVKKSLESRDLELSAKTFISDFEQNIRTTFSEFFPDVDTQGCYFHYGKAIWSRVKKGGMATFYSKKSSEQKFGSFIRLIIGLPFLKVEDIPRGIRNIEKVAEHFKVPKCRDFAKSMISYLNGFWMALPLELWNVFDVKTRTNNLAEGYNFALGNKKVISKHPNPYTLVSVIKDELNIASDSALSIVMSKPKKSVSKKHRKLESRRKELMHSYNRGNMELYLYQATIGNAFLNNLNRITDDTDPDPYGTGDYQTAVENEKEDDVNTSYIEEELNGDDELELSFDNNLCLRAKKILNLPEKELKKSKKVPKNKLQKPEPNSRKSIVYHPVVSREAVTDESLVGGALREKRVELDKDDDQGSATILIAAAAAVTASVITLSPEKESEDDPDKKSEKELEVKRAKKKTLSDGWFSAMEKLRELKFILSPTQQSTPMDGNCLYHVLADQSIFIDHAEARRRVVENIMPLVENGTIFWNEELLMIDWIHID